MKFEQEKILVFYKRLISLYPETFRERFGESMEQTFRDVCNDKTKLKGRISPTFVLSAFAETSAGVFKENLYELKGATMKSLISKNKSALIFGLIAFLPFFVLNMIAVKQIEPLSSIFRINTGGNFWDYPVGHITAIVALLLLPVGAFISMSPIFRKDSDGKRYFYFANIVLAVILTSLFALITYALFDEIYRCSILQVPNCD
jgi:hypothetical protein